MIDKNSSDRAALFAKELESLNNSLGKVIQKILENRQIEQPEAEELNIPKTVYNMLIGGKFNRIKLPALFQCLLLLDHNVDLTINPIDKKQIKLHDLQPQTVKFKKGKG